MNERVVLCSTVLLITSRAEDRLFGVWTMMLWQCQPRVLAASCSFLGHVKSANPVEPETVIGIPAALAASSWRAQVWMSQRQPDVRLHQPTSKLNRWPYNYRVPLSVCLGDGMLQLST